MHNASTNFLELRTREVRRFLLLGSSVNIDNTPPGVIERRGLHLRHLFLLFCAPAETGRTGLCQPWRPIGGSCAAYPTTGAGERPGAITAADGAGRADHGADAELLQADGRLPGSLPSVHELRGGATEWRPRPVDP